MLATCNRVEIYADVDRFHGSVEAICPAAVRPRRRRPPDDVVPHLYVHYDDGAVSHLFHVAAGLDSMVVGEGQILGQAREALRIGQELGTVGPALNAAFQQALRVGKRTHAETDDRPGRARRWCRVVAGPRRRSTSARSAGKRAVVVGAGAMAVARGRHPVPRRGRRHRGRQPHRDARPPAWPSSTAAAPLPLDAGSPRRCADADVLVSCTGAVGAGASTAETLRREPGAAPTRPLAVIDLALPHDVDPAVGRAARASR